MGRYDQNLKVFNKWIKQGRGQGYLQEYKPWLTVFDVPSSGRSHRVWCNTAGRVAHLLSDLELAYLLVLDWSEHVTDIREQFPLDITATKEIARIHGVRHPNIRGEDIVMSSDFLASTAKPHMPLFAVQVKPSSELTKIRVREKLAIEEQYWLSLGIPFQLVTEKALSKNMLYNIRWCFPCIRLQFPEEVNLKIVDFWRSEMRLHDGKKLVEMTTVVDANYRNELGIALGQIKYLIAKRVLTFDMSKPFHQTMVNELHFATKHALVKRGLII